MKMLPLLLLAGMSLQSSLSAYEQAFAKTDVGDIELKTIPASRVIASEARGYYLTARHRTG